MSILPNMSKIYEKLMYQQLYDHFDSISSPKRYGFREGQSAQHCPMLDNKINRLPEKALRIVYLDLNANFDGLLEEDNSFSICHRNIQTLAIEIFKFLKGLSLPKMKEVFQVKPSAPYSLRDKNELDSRNPKTVAYWTESISFLVPKIWSIVPQEIKNCKSLDSF